MEFTAYQDSSMDVEDIYIPSFRIPPMEPSEQFSIRKRKCDEPVHNIESEENVTRREKITKVHKEQKKTIHKRQALFRFGPESPNFGCRIICREPFGILAELLEEIEENILLKDISARIGDRFWCKWDGSVDSSQTPVFEGIHNLVFQSLVMYKS